VNQVKESFFLVLFAA